MGTIDRFRSDGHVEPSHAEMFLFIQTKRYLHCIRYGPNICPFWSRPWEVIAMFYPEPTHLVDQRVRVSRFIIRYNIIANS
jgi:hypothetical protein